MEALFWIEPVVLNYLFWRVIKIVQDDDAKQGRIFPRNSRFLYMQDFRTNGFLGNILGLSMVDAAVMVLLYRIVHSSFILTLIVGVAVVVAVLAAYCFYRYCTSERHWPDWGYPKTGAISWGGRVHLLYFTTQIAIGCIGLILIIPAILGHHFLPLAVGLGGAGIYGYTYWLDRRAGRLF